MTKFAFHPATETQLKSYATHFPSALLIAGAEGVGLSSAAEYIAGESKAILYTVLPEKDEKIDVEKGSITVDSIRRLYDLTKTIEPKGRLIVIDYAERMAKPAQNAFLKLLEEPSEGTHFILLTHQPGLLLSTILSRSQRLDMRPITLEQSEELLDRLKIRDEHQKAQLLFIASGLPAELNRLADDKNYFEKRVEVIKDAREYVTGNAYGRLLIAKKYKDDRAQALLMIADSMKLLQNTLVKGGSDTSIATIGQLEELYSRIQGNGNIRLQLASL